MNQWLRAPRRRRRGRAGPPLWGSPRPQPERAMAAAGTPAARPAPPAPSVLSGCPLPHSPNTPARASSAAGKGLRVWEALGGHGERPSLFPLMAALKTSRRGNLETWNMFVQCKRPPRVLPLKQTIYWSEHTFLTYFSFLSR